MKSTLWTVMVFYVFMNVSGDFAGHDRTVRIRRQSNPGDAFVDAVFQIPIQTLTSVGSLVKATRPVIMQVRQRLQQNLNFQPQRFSFPGRPQASSYQRPQASSYQRPSRAHDRQSRPTSSYNRLHQRPSAKTDQFFRESNNV